MPLFLQRPEPGEYVEYYGNYIARVPDGDLIESLARHADETIALLRQQPAGVLDFAYAEGKWTVKEVVGHVCDAERIFSYRLLRIGRGDETPLSGFDENIYVPAARSGERTLESLLEEFAAVRRSTIALIAGLPEEAWSRSGVANNSPISARAIAYIIGGHELHHREVLQTRYLAHLTNGPG
ncbi:MAG TPA: DinB family protein [Longimicrobiales bacterium]|nr:DinB family protein [Longimicrobiales bacterium]